MTIPFTKAHGAKNDFLLTWAGDAPREGLSEIARAICDRHTGAGADGWILVTPGRPGSAHDAEILLLNADGSTAEISGNGTRCAAAFLIHNRKAGDRACILTGAGLRVVRLIHRRGRAFQLEMEMGMPVSRPEETRYPLSLSGGARDVTLLNVGNPQCAVFVDDFDFGWCALGAEIELHPHFPSRTNVSFVRVVDRHAIEVRFYERGVGETMSSGTGSTGAVWASALRGLVDSPVRVVTPGGPLDIRWDEAVHLSGPAEVVATGEFFFEREN